MYKYFDNYTSTLVAQFILTPATKLKNKTNDIKFALWWQLWHDKWRIQLLKRREYYIYTS